MPAERNAEWASEWAPVAVAQDIMDGTVAPASLATGPIAVWRTAQGQLKANGDRCPHRGMRLSHGFVRGDTLSCIYHGWRFGADGVCQHIPAHPDVVPPKTINCGPLPVAEQNGVVWAAASQPDVAPPDLGAFEALRSVVIMASAAGLLRTCGGTEADGAVTAQLGDIPARLLLTERMPDQQFVIALIPAGSSLADRLAASAALDALQRQAEADDSQEAPA